MTIDFHTHIFPASMAEKVIVPMGRSSRARHYADGTAEGLLASMARAGVDRSVVLPVATNARQVEMLNATSAEANAKLAGRGIFSFGAMHPDYADYKAELARVKEELVDCTRRLKELMPSHKVRCRTTWAGVDGWRWDDLQYQTWAELESSEEPDGPTELDRMRLAVRLARERAVTDKQGEYLAQVEGGKKAAQVAREAGRHRGTVSRTVGRGRTKIAKEAKALYEVLQAQQGPGPLVVDLADGRVLEAVLSLPEKYRDVVYLHYYETYTAPQISRILGKNVNTVYTLLTRSKQLLREKLEGCADE